MTKKSNKIFQYVLTIIVILFLVYLQKIFIEFNLIKAIILTICILFLILFLIDRYVKINIDKLFKNIG